MPITRKEIMYVFSLWIHTSIKNISKNVWTKVPSSEQEMIRCLCCNNTKIQDNLINQTDHKERCHIKIILNKYYQIYPFLFSPTNENPICRTIVYENLIQKISLLILSFAEIIFNTWWINENQNTIKCTSCLQLRENNSFGLIVGHKEDCIYKYLIESFREFSHFLMQPSAIQNLQRPNPPLIQAFIQIPYQPRILRNVQSNQ
jgi:hypothetical protein